MGERRKRRAEPAAYRYRRAPSSPDQTGNYVFLCDGCLALCEARADSQYSVRRNICQSMAVLSLSLFCYHFVLFFALPPPTKAVRKC